MASSKAKEAARRMKVRRLRANPMMDDVAVALNAEPTYEEIKVAEAWEEAFGLPDLIDRERAEAVRESCLCNCHEPGDPQEIKHETCQDCQRDLMLEAAGLAVREEREQIARLTEENERLRAMMQKATEKSDPDCPCCYGEADYDDHAPSCNFDQALVFQLRFGGEADKEAGK